MSAPQLKSVEFRQQREAAWQDLEDLLEKIERRGVRATSAEELMRLPLLYRAALSSLSVARAISLDRNLTSYLENLCTRAYLCLYSTRRRPIDVLTHFLSRAFPLRVYQLRYHLLGAALIFFAGVGVAAALTARDDEMFYTFVSSGYAQGRGPHASTESLRHVLFSGASTTDGALSQFASHLMTHNARIGILSATLGVVFGLPVLYFMFENGLILGAFISLYASRGLTVELFSWLLPHGVTEILALLLCGGAGLALGEAVLFPGASSRRAHLARRGREAGVVILGAVGMFFMAGLIEGFFRQRVQDIPTRYLLASATAIFWTLYLGALGAQRYVEALRAPEAP